MIGLAVNAKEPTTPQHAKPVLCFCWRLAATMHVNDPHEEVAAEASRSIVQALVAEELFTCMLTLGIKVTSGRALLQGHYLINSGCHDLA